MFRKTEPKMTHFSRVLVPVLTPLGPDLSVDAISLKALTAHLMNHGARDFFALSPIGESFFLDVQKRAQALEIISSTVGKRGKVIAGCFGRSDEEIIDAVREAQRFTDFCAVNVPEASLVSEISFMDFFDSLFMQTKANIFLYNSPLLFKRNIPVLGVEKIAGWERLVGVIDCSRNFEYFRAMLEHLRAHEVRIFQGAEEFALDSLNIGCAGLSPGLANVLPSLFLALSKAHDSMSTSECIRAQAQISGLLKDFFPFSKRIQAYKRVLASQGLVQEFHSPQLPFLEKRELERLESFEERSIALE